jgi:hypothetical protein
MIEVRRPSDGELCGGVRALASEWQSLTVFGGILAQHCTRETAEQHVLDVSLASLAERWWYRPDPSTEWQIVCIQEANSQSVRLALDYYSMPGVPTITITRAEMQSGTELTLDPET